MEKTPLRSLLFLVAPLLISGCYSWSLPVGDERLLSDLDYHTLKFHEVVVERSNLSRGPTCTVGALRQFRVLSVNGARNLVIVEQLDGPEFPASVNPTECVRGDVLVVGTLLAVSWKNKYEEWEKIRSQNTAQLERPRHE